MDLNPNKRLKEEFVSNLTGSTKLEIAALSAIIPILVVLRKWSTFSQKNSNLKKDDDAKTCERNWRHFMCVISIDFLSVVLPILLIFTVLADSSYTCALSLIAIMSFYILRERSRIFFKEKETQVSSFRADISSYRVLVVLSTCLSILAVDFKIYPRRYAKTETYGTSLMDLGVGSFVVMNSLVSRQARNVNKENWREALGSVAPLLIFGFGRLIFTSGADYQVHVSEYGVHWNFFFTLAALHVLSFFISIHPRHCGAVGLAFLVGHQTWLLSGLNKYLMSNERKPDIISQNKEGIYSLFGYWGMYLIGVYLGHQLFFRNSQTENRKIQATRLKIWVISAFFWLSTIVLDHYVERVSRRTCNFSYVTLVLAQNFQVLAILTLAKSRCPTVQNLVLEDAFNQNLLGVFILANVLTGVVNLSVDTLSASSVTSLAILSAYSCLLCAMAGVVSFVGVRFKFWRAVPSRS